jgi:hypothetical protein
MKRPCIFDKEVCVQQFVRVFVRIGRGRLGVAEVNRVLVARGDSAGRRILPCPLTLEAELIFVIGERAENIGRKELMRSDRSWSKCNADPSRPCSSTVVQQPQCAHA